MTHSYGFTLHYANACTSLVTWINQNLVNSMETAILLTTRPDPSTAINALCLTQCGFIRKPVSQSFWGLYIHVLCLYKWSPKMVTKWSPICNLSLDFLLLFCETNHKEGRMTTTGHGLFDNSYWKSDTTKWHDCQDVSIHTFTLHYTVHCTLQPHARGLHV